MKSLLKFQGHRAENQANRTHSEVSYGASKQNKHEPLIESRLEGKMIE